MSPHEFGLSRRRALVGLGRTGGTVAFALTVSATAAGAAAASPTDDLQRASETLRQAMLAGDGKVLDAMLHDLLDYMHSSGHSQTKADLMRVLAGKHFFAGLTYPEQSFRVTGDAGVVKLTIDQVKNVTGGTTRASRIKVLQSWTRNRGHWQLLTRASALMESPLMRPACPPGAAPKAG